LNPTIADGNEKDGGPAESLALRQRCAMKHFWFSEKLACSSQGFTGRRRHLPQLPSKIIE